jgi:hypothetical protein
MLEAQPIPDNISIKFQENRRASQQANIFLYFSCYQNTTHEQKKT